MDNLFSLEDYEDNNEQENEMNKYITKSDTKPNELDRYFDYKNRFSIKIIFF